MPELFRTGERSNDLSILLGVSTGCNMMSTGPYTLYPSQLFSSCEIGEQCIFTQTCGKDTTVGAQGDAAAGIYGLKGSSDLVSSLDSGSLGHCVVL
jgi:hypothetical protein